MSPTAFYGSWLAVGILGVVIGLLSWQLTERRNRDDDMPDEDRIFFARQDLRRWLVVAVMTGLALGTFFGSTQPYRSNGRPNAVFVAIWLGNFALVFFLTILAMMDWLATRRYARRHRADIVRESVKALRDELHARPSNSVPKEMSQGSNGSPVE